MTARGLSLNGVTVDFPHQYTNAGGSYTQAQRFARLFDLEDEAKKRGLKLQFVFNDDSTASMANTTVGAQTYHNKTLEYIKEYETRNTNGGKGYRKNPDVYIIQSWFPYNPPKMLPETEPYTMTYLVAEVLRHLKEGKPID